MNPLKVDVMEYQPLSSWPAFPAKPAAVEGALASLSNLFVQNVAHELRTPLTILMGYAELLRDGYGGGLSPEQQQLMATMLKQVYQLRALTERVGLLLGAQAGLTVRLPVSLAEIVAGVVENIQPQAALAGVVLTAELQPEMPLINGDARHLSEALTCLLENAVKFTPAGGQVSVNLYHEPGWLCVAIRDTGIGIAESELAQLFSGFYQIDGSTTRRYGGIGLGLTLVGMVAKTHGGLIELSSQPGQGSHFTFKLPER
jgi:signal transduction histidine kinase